MTFGTLAVDAIKAVLPFVAAAMTGLITKGWQIAIRAEKNLQITGNAASNALIQSGLEWATTEAKTIVENAVNMTNQTLVNEAKANGTWDATKAAQALENALQAAENSLASQAKSILQQEIQNLPSYLTMLIEAYVPLAPTKTSSQSLGQDSRAR